MDDLAWAEIDLEACRHNCAVLRKAAGGRGLFAVVKADGYGHGMALVAQAIADSVDGFCVFLAGDGVRLRDLGIKKPVLVLGGVHDVEEAKAVASSGLWLSVGTKSCLEFAVSMGNTLGRAVVKVQTGMHRLGLPVEQVRPAVENLAKAGCRDIALMHHYSDADATGGTAAQDEVMANLLSELNLPYSASNSAATLSQPMQDEEFVRCGIAVYGCTPFADKEKPAAKLGLRPAMNFCGKVISVQDVRAGGTVGYGSRWQAKKDTKVAVVACGYSHGYPRHAPDGTPVWINGKKRALAGRVSMEMLTVECPEGDVAIGDTAQLWGDKIPVDKVANLSGTIGYELVSALPQSVPRKH